MYRIAGMILESGLAGFPQNNCDAGPLIHEKDASPLSPLFLALIKCN